MEDKLSQLEDELARLVRQLEATHDRAGMADTAKASGVDLLGDAGRVRLAQESQLLSSAIGDVLHEAGRVRNPGRRIAKRLPS